MSNTAHAPTHIGMRVVDVLQHDVHRGTCFPQLRLLVEVGLEVGAGGQHQLLLQTDLHVVEGEQRARQETSPRQNHQDLRNASRPRRHWAHVHTTAHTQYTTRQRWSGRVGPSSRVWQASQLSRGRTLAMGFMMMGA